MPSFKDIKDLANNPIAGVVTTAMRPTPAGIAYTGANIASKAFTGKTIPQHLAGTIKGPATGSGNVGRDKKGDVVSEGGSFRDPQQKKTLRGKNSKGGLVAYKGISDLHNKVCGHK